MTQQKTENNHSALKVLSSTASKAAMAELGPLFERRSGIALGVGVVATSAYGRAVTRFVLDSRVELRKIVWPGQRETLVTTAVVFGFVVIGGSFFWVVDLILAWATKHLTGQGG